LRNVKGLNTIIHFGASTIGIDTLEKSAGNIPEEFMRGCGLSNELIGTVSKETGVDLPKNAANAKPQAVDLQSLADQIKKAGPEVVSAVKAALA